MSSPLCNSTSWLTGKQNSDWTAEARDITLLTVNLATFIAPLSLVTSTCSQEIFVFKHLTWSSELWVLFPRAAFPPLFTWVICFFSLERIPDFIISSMISESWPSTKLKSVTFYFAEVITLLRPLQKLTFILLVSFIFFFKEFNFVSRKIKIAFISLPRLFRWRIHRKFYNSEGSQGWLWTTE